MKTIFIVDDDEMVRKVLFKRLNDRFDYKVFAISSGEECLRQLGKKPDIVILDYYFYLDGTINGQFVLEEIINYNPSTKVIMLSGQSRPSKVGETIDTGAFEYVVKDDMAYDKIEKIISEL